MTDEFELSADEISEARSIIARARPGLYTLANLYGPEWKAKRSPTTFGARFKATVMRGSLPGIELHPQKTGANALQYTVYGR